MGTSLQRAAMEETERLIAGVLEGNVAATAQLITALENNRPAGRAALRQLYPRGGHAHIVGFTGAPGSGKSTLVASLARALRGRGRTVAVVAVDPSSSLTGGAILGDRIRMQELTFDPGVFFRSMSSRGALGGLSRATVDAVCVLDAAGFDHVIIETVGVGQAEIDVVGAAHTVVVVSVPGLGDDIQTLKAGLLEVADIHVVNKADRPDAGNTLAALRRLLTLDGSPAADAWEIPLVATSAVQGTGIDELIESIDKHARWLRESGNLARRERTVVVRRLSAIAHELVTARLSDPAEDGKFAALVQDVSDRRIDPHTAAEQLIAGVTEEQQ